MFVVDLAIAKKYWDPVFDIIQRQFASGQYEKIKDGIYLINFRSNRIYVAAEEHSDRVDVIGWLYLSRYVDRNLKRPHTWHVWEVEQSFVFKDFRGMGYGHLLYTCVIEDEGLVLASGSQQSKHAREYWKRMVASERYTMWAHDFLNLEEHHGVLYDEQEDEIYSRLKLYDVKWTDETANRDVRLLAMKKD